MQLKHFLCSSAAALALSFGFAGSAAAQTEVQFWHAMGGTLGDRVSELVDGFNKEQKEYKVNAVYKGSYTETMTGAIAAFRARQHPHIVQVFEVGTATMMAAKGAVYPVHQLMKDAGEPFDPSAYLSTVTGYYSTPDGKLLSMPFNSSTPVFYWNKAAFKKAGLDPEKPPRTWPEVEEYGKKLIASGFQCGFSTQWQTWIQIENFGAWHNLPFATMENGFGGTNIKLTINDPVRVKHISKMAEWQKNKIFVYGGREGKPNSKFSTGECPMFMGSSGSADGFIKAMQGTEIGITMLPYWPDVAGAPQNSIIGGATLWVLAGKPKEEYKGVARFFSYLSRPEVQAKWHQQTGYVPITNASFILSKDQGFYQQRKGFDTAVLQLTNKTPTANSKGLRIGNFVQIRDIMDEELEAVWDGKKTAKQALDSAVERGNRLLADFHRANQ
ncbi:MAG: sn-glycerol-3-phosphate ABC transporter substrate-binding protein UgpB [Alphaproteobacteria bacterium]|nr:sn-glycerol-3-phosphate ABC transporter substrate-binding protein UgpB [Alphaproteobacteria bacterium]